MGPKEVPAGRGQVEGAQRDEGVCGVETPAHAALAHALFDECLAGRLGHATADGQLALAPPGVIHAVQMIGKIGHRALQAFQRAGR